MQSKTCFKCNEEKVIDEFYKNPSTKDGRVNKCKSCTKSDVLAHRAKNIERIREYDRNRGCRRTRHDLAEYRKKYPNKHRAHRLVRNAINSGKLFKQNCEVCGTDYSVHAHHDDYAKPLNVRWLCAAHHHQWHAKHGEALNP